MAVFYFFERQLHLNKLKKLNDQSSLENHISNPPVTIHVSDIIDIRASDVYTSHHSIKRKIEFINRKSKEFVISLLEKNKFIEDFIEYYLLRRIKSLGLVWNKSSVAFSGLHINKKSNIHKT